MRSIGLTESRHYNFRFTIDYKTKEVIMAAKEIIYEADNRTGINHEGRLANTPVTRLTASSIIGDSIESSSGEDLGKIDNLMVNLTDGTIEYAVVEYGSFLGMGGKLFAI